jgi:hypothetical protein
MTSKARHTVADPLSSPEPRTAREGDGNRQSKSAYRSTLPCRIDAESLVILSGQARLLECLDIGENIFLSGAVRTKLDRIEKLRNQLAELGLGQQRNGIVQHVENILATHSANGSPELVPIYMLVGHGPRFRSSAVSSFIILFSVAGRNRDGTLLQDLRARTSERAIFREKSQNPHMQALPGHAKE